MWIGLTRSDQRIAWRSHSRAVRSFTNDAGKFKTALFASPNKGLSELHSSAVGQRRARNGVWDRQEPGSGNRDLTLSDFAG